MSADNGMGAEQSAVPDKGNTAAQVTIAQAYRRAVELLQEVAGEQAAFEARQLLSQVLDCPAPALHMRTEEAMQPAQWQLLQGLIQRRRKHEPLQYILVEWAFMGLPIRVRPGALIPRPETENLAELSLKLARERGYRTALDVCCGTGCIGIALAKLGGLAVTASDVSPACAALAQENAALNGVRLSVLQGSWFAPVTGRYDIIACNPPYLTAADMHERQPELLYEPEEALFGGQDGLDAYRQIRKGYAAHLRTGGVLLLELGAGQAGTVQALFGGGRLVRDYHGIDRILCVETDEQG